MKRLRTTGHPADYISEKPTIPTPRVSNRRICCLSATYGRGLKKRLKHGWKVLVLYPAADGVAAASEELADGVQAYDGAGLGCVGAFIRSSLSVLACGLWALLLHGAGLRGRPPSNSFPSSFNKACRASAGLAYARENALPRTEQDKELWFAVRPAVMAYTKASSPKTAEESREFTLWREMQGRWLSRSIQP